MILTQSNALILEPQMKNIQKAFVMKRKKGLIAFFFPIVCQLCDFAPHSFKRAILLPIIFPLSDFMIPMTFIADVSAFYQLMCVTCVISFLKKIKK